MIHYSLAVLMFLKCESEKNVLSNILYLNTFIYFTHYKPHYISHSIHKYPHTRYVIQVI